MATDDPHPESSASSTKRDDGPPTTIDEAAPDTRIDPERVDDAIAGLKAISRTIKMADGDPIPDPAPPSLARASAPSSEAITLKKKGEAAKAPEPAVDSSKPVLAGAAAEPATDEAPKPKDLDATQADPAALPPPVEAKPKRAIRETLTDDGGLSQTLPDPVPLEPTVDERRVAEKDAKPRGARRRKPSTLSNPFVWLVGALMIAALVGLGIFLSSQGGDPPQKREKTAKPTSTPNVPLPQPQTATNTAQQPNPTTTESPTPVIDTPQPTLRPTPTTPKPNGSGTTPKPTPTPTTSGGTPFTIPSAFPTVFFPGVGTPPGQSGSTGP